MLRRLPCYLLFLVALTSQAGPPSGRLNGQTFVRYSPLATPLEVARRGLSPLTYDRFERYLHFAGRHLATQAINLEEERFDLYVPARAGNRREYGLLVWLAPQEDYPVPRDWVAELDRRGIIYVSAQRSGNTRLVLDRRIPLALHAAENVINQYPVDRQRVYVAGFSGGSRTALKLAVGYPDLFRGALLNAGSDVFGERGLSLPDAALTALLQERSRLVYTTGVRDMPNKRQDAASRVSSEARCIRHLHVLSMPGLEHAPPDRRSFSRAMALLDSDPAPDAGLQECRNRIMAVIENSLDSVGKLLAGGEVANAGERLGELDEEWGGLAAPGSVVLARRISERLNAASQ